MPADPRIRRSRRTRERRWDQTSFLDEDGATTGAGRVPREVEQALGVADHAADTASRRTALDRVSDSLAQRAMRRWRKPVPKRRDSNDAP